MTNFLVDVPMVIMGICFGCFCLYAAIKLIIESRKSTLFLLIPIFPCSTVAMLAEFTLIRSILFISSGFGLFAYYMATREPTRKCEKCHSVIRDGIFCPSCGDETTQQSSTTELDPTIKAAKHGG